jgi:hypothetical protein
LLELCVAPKPQGTPLPPPAEQAGALKKQAVQLISTWAANYGQHYPQLMVAQRYETIKPGVAHCPLPCKVYLSLMIYEPDMLNMDSLNFKRI